MSNRVVDLREGRGFSNLTALTVIALKSLGVADSKIGAVMRAVSELVGISLLSTPSASTCRNFALAALYVGKTHVQARLSDILEKGEPVCLASDETTKGTMKLQTFGVHSADGTFTCLGIEQVAEKSAQTAFNALVSSVEQLPGAPTDFFKKFVVSVNSTMSDLAQTELKFNKIVEKYRMDAVPEVVENFANWAEGEKEQFLKFSQFFCQLHVISNFTKIVLKCLLEHELAVSKVKQLDEPTVFALVKLVAQLFGQRGSGLHGILSAWTAWCKEKCVNRFVFESFLGNRFNIVFLLASRVFFHRHHLGEFAEECEAFKPELKRIRELLNTPMIVAHLELLGFCDQLITAPLWRLAENSEHILSTCRYALQLQNWLRDCTQHPGSFFDGIAPTPNLQADSPTTSGLLLRALVGTDPSEMGLQAASLVSSASLEYFSRAFADFLPGGMHCQEAEDIRESTKAAPATNRNVESVFGLVSHLFDTKPNMRLDVRVAFTLITKNHTLDWLRALPEDVQDSILTESRGALSKLRSDAAARQVDIDKVILQKIREKNQTASKKQTKKTNDRRTCTENIVRYGFWKTDEEIDSNIEKYPTEKQKREAVVSQLRFRQKVLEQPPPTTKFYAITANQKPLPLQQLVQKLRELIALDAEDGELLAAADHQFIGARFSQRLPASGAAVTTKSGYVEDVSGGFITLKYEDDETTHRIPLESFESLIQDGSLFLD